MNLEFMSDGLNVQPLFTREVLMIIIPDYLIIDEIRRREENSWQPETLQLPLPSYEMPEDDLEYPSRQEPQKKDKSNKNGVIIIDMNSYKRII